MYKKLFFLIFCLSLVFITASCKKQQTVLPDDTGKIIFYYSLTCPHCQNVEKYIADNNVRDKITFEEKEVSQNQDYAAQFYDKVTKCNIKPNEAGVPLLWDGSACILGDEKIINYFFTKINEK